MKKRSKKALSDSQADRVVTELSGNGVLVNENGLEVVGRRVSLLAYCRDLIARLPFIWEEARSKAFQSGRGTLLGSLWLIIDPLLQVGLYAVVFGLIMKTNRGMDNFIGFLVIGVVFFRIATQGINDGAGLIKRSRPLISSFAFPRAALAVSTYIRQVLDNIPSILVALVLALSTQIGKPIGISLIMIIPLVLVVAVFNLGWTLIVARATAFVPDLIPLVSTVVRALFFISGVFFSIERFETHKWLQDFVLANPIYRIISLTRAIVLDSSWGAFNDWAYIIAWSICLTIVGFIYFWRAEARYAGVV